MASGRKNRGSRHRSHRHKQQKLDDTGSGGGSRGEAAAESDTEQNLRHGPNPNPSPKPKNPNPNPNPNPNISSRSSDSSKHPDLKSSNPRHPNPWDMEPLPPNVEGPSVLKQLDKIESNADRNSNHHYDSSKSSQSKRRKDSTLEMDRWEGGTSDGTISVAAQSENSVAIGGDGLYSLSYDRKESRDDGDRKGKGKGKGKEREEEADDVEEGKTGDFVLHSKAMDVHDVSFQKEVSRIHVTSKVMSTSSSRRESSKDADFDINCSMSMGSIEPERKRKKTDGSQKSKRFEEDEDYHHSLDKGIYRIPDEKHKEESFKPDNSRGSWSKDEKEREDKRKSERSRDDRSAEGRKEVVSERKDSVSDARHKEDMHGDVKEKDSRVAENRHKENRSKESRFKDERERDTRLKNQGDIREEEKLKSDTGSRKEYANRHREDKGAELNAQDEKSRRGREQHMKEDGRLKRGKIEGEQEEDKERSERYKDDGFLNAKSKQEKKKGDMEQSCSGKNREELRVDHGVEFKGKYDKKFSEREQEYNARPVKVHTEKERIEKQHDNRDMDDREKHERQRGSRDRNGRHVETSSKDNRFHNMSEKDSKFHNASEKDSKFHNVSEKDSKFHNASEKDSKLYNVNEKDSKYRDDRGTSEREKSKDDGDRNSKYNDDGKERRWGSSPQEERSKDGKEGMDALKHFREIDDRRRYDVSDGKHRTDRGKSDRRYSDRAKEERVEDGIPVDRSGGIREDSKESGVGVKALYNKESDGQPEFRGTHDADARDSKVHGTARADRSTPRSSSRPVLQDQDRIVSAISTKDANTSESRSRRIRESDAVDTAIVDRDNNRARGRPVEEVSDSVHEKAGRRNKFEASVSISSSSGTRRPRERNWHMIDHMDQGKQYAGFDEEVRSWEPRSSNQDSDDERRRSFSHDRSRDSRLSLSPRGGQDTTLSKDANTMKRKLNKFSQGSGSTKARRADEGSNDRLERGSQMNRIQSDGLVSRQMLQNRSSASLPPPPPYRPGVDNPAVVGAQSSYGEDKQRESARYDRKGGGGSHLNRPDIVGPGDAWGGFGMGNWNPHGQGPVPGPGNMFASFPQMGSGGFLGMGQQFHVPQMFGPRPSADVGFGGARFHMGDGGLAFPGHGHVPGHGPMMGWHRFPDGSESHRPLSGFMDASWEGPGRFPDERQRFGHPEWDQFSQGLSRGGGWEGAPEPWQAQGQAVDVKSDSNLHHSNREGVHPAVKSKDEGVNLEVDAEKTQKVKSDQMPELPVASPVHPTEHPGRKTDSKGSKRSRARLQRILLHANVCAKLVDDDLYEEYLKLLPPSELKARETQDDIDVSETFIDEDLEFEADLEAQALLSTPNPLARILPSISDNIYKDALKLYTRRDNHIQKSLVGFFALPDRISLEHIQS